MKKGHEFTNIAFWEVPLSFAQHRSLSRSHKDASTGPILRDYAIIVGYYSQRKLVRSRKLLLLALHFESSHASVTFPHRRTGHCGVLAIATWAAWFWAAQGRLLTKKKEERKGRKGKIEERKKEKEKKRKKRREESEEDETDMGRLFRV